MTLTSGRPPRVRAAIDPAPVVIDDPAALVAKIHGTPKGRQLRVVGAGHSVPAAIGVDSGRGTNISLGRDFVLAGMPKAPNPPVVAEGGMRLGGDPDQEVPVTDGLLYWMSDLYKGPTPLSVPDLGGITHQTVGGFLSTGSSGGSLKYAFEDAITAVTMIDGTGKLQTFEGAGGNGTLPIAAAGASLGLLGVITSVTINPVPRFAIYGQESTSEIGDAGYDLFSSGSDGLASFLAKNDYCRIMWWPQPKVDKLVTWTANQQPLPSTGFVPRPYMELGDPGDEPKAWPSGFWELVGNVIAALFQQRAGVIKFFQDNEDQIPPDMAQWLGRIIAALVENDPGKLKEVLTDVTLEELNEFGVDLYFTLLGNRETNTLARNLFDAMFPGTKGQTPEQAWEGTWSPLIMNGIFLIDDANTVRGTAQQFHDYGDTGLPMDDQISDYLMPTEFTELWVPIERTADAMGVLKDHYAAGYLATGTYACELYAAKQSKFWMSPASVGDVVRIDVFWFARNGDQTPQQFYGPIWDKLHAANIPFRPHWGKYLPPVSGYGPSYWNQMYGNNLTQFLDLRRQLDPNQIFVNDYWRAQFGIT